MLHAKLSTHLTPVGSKRHAREDEEVVHLAGYSRPAAQPLLPRASARRLHCLLQSLPRLPLRMPLVLALALQYLAIAVDASGRLVSVSPVFRLDVVVGGLGGCC